MLTKCVECQREVSDQAEACPHCGHPMRAVDPDPPYNPASAEAKKSKAKPIFLALAVVALIVGDGTPRFLIFFPVMCALGFSVVSMVRGERWSGWAWLTLILGFVMWGFSSTDIGRVTAEKAATETAEQSARIVSSRWVKDPTFAGRGAIEWFAEVENLSGRNIQSVEIEFTTYDAEGKIVSTDSGYAQGILPASRGAAHGYADFYRNEKTAAFRVKRVNFAR